MKWLIVLLFITSAYAKEACYELENYGELCVTYQNSPINSEVQVTVYKGEEIMETIATKSSEYFQGGQFCGGKEHDCWTIPGSFQIHASSAKYEVFLSLDRWMSVNSCVRCSSSSVTVKEGKEIRLRVR